MVRDSRRADMKVTEDLESSLEPAPDGVVKIDAFEIIVSDGISHAIYFRDQKLSGRLMLYHAGFNHGLEEAGGDRAIRSFSPKVTSCWHSGCRILERAIHHRG
jgi:hypothetical protein